MISPVVADKLKGKRTRPGLSGGFGGLRGKVGPKEMTKEIVVDKNAEGPFQWFVVDVSAGHAAGSVRIHVIYLYMLL